MDEKLDKILQILQARPGHPYCSNFPYRGSGDGNSGSHASVQRTYSDPADSKPRNISETVLSVTPGNVPSVTLSTPESVPTLAGSVSDISSLGSHSQSGASAVDKFDGHDFQECAEDVGDAWASSSSDAEKFGASGSTDRYKLADKKQLSDVTEESFADSREDLHGIAGDNSTAHDRGAHISDEWDKSAPVWQKREPSTSPVEGHGKRPSSGKMDPRGLADRGVLSDEAREEDVPAKNAQDGSTAGSLEERVEGDQPLSSGHIRTGSAKRRALVRSQPVRV